MVKGSFIKAGFWSLILAGIVLLTIVGCDGLEGIVTGGGGGNNPPIIEIQALKTSVSSGERITILITSSSDPDGDPLTFNWKVISADGEDVTAGVLTISDDFVTFTAPLVTTPTSYIVTLEADDGKEGKTKVTVTITVNPLASGEAIFILDEESVEIPLPTDTTELATATVKAIALTKDEDTDELDAESKDESVATAKVEKKAEGDKTHLITITAVAVGETDVFVTADSTKETKTIHVGVFKSGEAFLSLGGVSVINVAVGKTVEVEANAKTTDGKDDEIKAVSLKPEIATVEVIGNIIRIIGVDAGVTDVTVESIVGQLKKKLEVNVTKSGEPTLIVDAFELLFIPLGEKRILSVTTAKADGSPDSVSATSKPISVATISLSGSSGNTYTYEVNGVSTGDATITFESGSKLTEVVNVKVDVAPILLLDPKNVAIVIDDPPVGIQVIAAIDAEGEKDTFTAEIDDDSVATISMSGDLITITPVAEGSTTITVKLGSDPTITATVTVTVFQAGTALLLLDEDSLSVESGKSGVINVTAQKADGTADPFTAQINDSSIATVTTNVSLEQIIVTGASAGGATITVTSSSALTVTAAVTVTSPPTAVASANPTSGSAPLTVNFDGGGSFDPDGGAIVSYSWDFGDGATGSTSPDSHTYNSPSTYTAVLTVTDDEGSTASDSVTITVDSTITATAGANGTITPSGSVAVNYGSNQTFTITPNTGYSITDVLVDGVSVGAVTTYTFSNVTANHTISASFAASSNLVAHFDFKGNANDISGNGNHGTIMNGATFTTDRNSVANSALQLDGVNDYVEVANEANFDLNEFTFYVIIKIPNYTNRHFILTKGPNNGYGNYTMYILESTIPNNAGKAGYVHDLSSGNWSSLVSISAIPTNTFIHIAVTYDSSNNFTSYIDGALARTASSTNEELSNNDPVRIGAHLGWGFYFEGVIDEVLIYDKELTATEINDLYNSL